MNGKSCRWMGRSLVQKFNLNDVGYCKSAYEPLRPPNANEGSKIFRYFNDIQTELQI